MGKADHLEEYQWKKGESGNPKGRPKGSVSIVAKIKQKFEENPEYFEQYVAEVLEDDKLRKEIIQQLDGKPHQTQDITSGGEKIVFIPSEIANKNDIETDATSL